MKGLLYKEYCMLKPQAKSWLGALAIMLVYAYIFKNISMLFMMISILGITYSISGFSYDKMYHCEEWIASMPVSRKQMVQSKYLFLLLLDLALAVLCVALVAGIALFAGTDLMEAAATGGAVLGVTVLMQAVALLLIYKMGPEKARIFYILIGFGPIVILFVLNEAGMLPHLTDALVYSALRATPLVVIAVLLLSFAASVRIYGRKEF